MVIGRSHPQTQNIRAVLVDNVRRVNTVAQGLTHLLALTVYGPAVGDDLLKGRRLPGGYAGEQRGLEPASVLVGTLQVHICRPLQIRALFKHRGMAGAGVEPHIHNVAFFVKALLCAAVGALIILRQEIFRLVGEPGVRAFLTKDLRYPQHQIFIHDLLAAVFTIKYGNGHTPLTLTGDAPIGALLDHGLHTVLAPGRIPLHILGGSHSSLLKIIYRAEPLRGGAENDGLMATPAMGILVDDLFQRKQSADFFQMLRNGLVGLIGGQPGELSGLLRQSALGIHRYNGGDLRVLLAHDKVIHTVTRCRVYAAGTALQRYMIAHDHQRGAVNKRVLGFHILQLAALDHTHGLIVRGATVRHSGVYQVGSHHIKLVAALDQRILKVGAYADGHVGRQGPGGGGPNHEIGLAQVRTQCSELAHIVRYIELYINRMAGILSVLNLRLGKGGLTVRAPIHRL